MKSITVIGFLWNLVWKFEYLLTSCYQEVETIYTHHQKTVIVDADAGNSRRKITAFVGGLDLCDGRYDTPQHHIFRTLQTVHKDDYHNPTYTVIS
jgi:phospholipase D1/2